MVILVTGATGYVGGRLVPELLSRGHNVRVLTRHASSLDSADWASDVEVIEGDATSEESLSRALREVDVAYYLLHSMDGQGDFRQRDLDLSKTFAAVAAREKVKQIVYLGGLHPDGELSPHLASRVEVGKSFLEASTPAAVLQAGIVLGSGSASYEMLRHLTERLPVMVAPKWLKNRIQPIAVDDAIHYLAGVSELSEPVNRTYDIGGPEVLTYEEMMRRYARLAGLGRRLIFPVPVLTPRLAGYWVGIVTPVESGVAQPLVGSLSHDAVCDEDDLSTLIGRPPGGSADFDTAVERALRDYDPRDWIRTLRRTSAAVAAAAAVGAIATNPRSAWYRSLRKPRWQPPAETFPIVWSALYAAVAVAGSASQTEQPDTRRQFATGLGVNLLLNSAWSTVFFGARRPDRATAVSALLTASSADLARRAVPAGRGKVAVFATYAAWCGFATVLSGWIARHNSSPSSAAADLASVTARRCGIE